jgi:hypothetical protein
LQYVTISWLNAYIINAAVISEDQTRQTTIFYLAFVLTSILLEMHEKISFLVLGISVNVTDFTWNTEAPLQKPLNLEKHSLFNIEGGDFCTPGLPISE